MKLNSSTIKSVSTWDDLTSIIHSLPEEEISMVIKRGDELIDYDLKTMSSPFPNMEAK